VPIKKLYGLVARPDGTEFRGRVSFSDRIEAIEATAQAGDDYVVPGFIDLQVNGSHGLDVMAGSAEKIRTIARHLAREGTTAFLPTAITSPIEQIIRVHAAIADAIASETADSSAQAAAILGMHLEGPFISPMRLGVHPKFNLEPRGEQLDRILALERLRLITLAPELEGAPAAIRQLTARGVAVSIGHSDATLEEARAGIAAGARMFTHLFNAMRPLHHRKPGVAGAAMIPSDALAAVIPDGVHVHPEMLRLVYRSRGAAGMLITTDKVAVANAGPDFAPAVGDERMRIAGGAARLRNGTLAGSIISMLDGVRLMVESVGVPIGEAALMAATNPARILGLADRGAISVGARADLIVLSRELKLKAVFISGHELA
jgi:N-acetylglucosamine-6-phosphate deacetylase